MSDLGQVAQLVTAVAILLNALGTLLTWKQGRIISEKVEQVHVATNSLQDKLIASTAKENFAAGLKQGEDNPRA